MNVGLPRVCNSGACEPARWWIIGVNVMNNCGRIPRVTNARDGSSLAAGGENANSKFASGGSSAQK